MKNQKNNKLEIYKMLVLSTAHISKETADLLEKDNVGIVTYPKEEYGWFIVVSDWWEDHDPIPEDLKNCLILAEKNGCDWLCLDCDGLVIDDLPEYNWQIERNQI